MITPIKYINALGASLMLNQGNYLVSTNDLRDFQWDFETYNRPSGFGGRAMFKRGVQSKSITIGIRGTTPNIFQESAARLVALTEPDILNGTPGKLYLGNQYLTCYLAVSSTVNYYARRANWVSKELTIVSVEPFWHEEITHHFMIGSPESVQYGKKYSGRYPYRYISELYSRALYNEHYTPCPMVITIYGAVKDPRLIIGGNEYKVTAEIIQNQRIIIDQLNKTIVAMNPSGATTNLFDARDKEHDIFKPIAPGTQHVIFTGDYAFDITLIYQRSEPTWS